MSGATLYSLVKKMIAKQTQKENFVYKTNEPYKGKQSRLGTLPTNCYIIVLEIVSTLETKLNKNLGPFGWCTYSIGDFVSLCVIVFITKNL